MARLVLVNCLIFLPSISITYTSLFAVSAILSAPPGMTTTGLVGVLVSVGATVSVGNVVAVDKAGVAVAGSGVNVEALVAGD